MRASLIMGIGMIVATYLSMALGVEDMTELSFIIAIVSFAIAGVLYAVNRY